MDPISLTAMAAVSSTAIAGVGMAASAAGAATSAAGAIEAGRATQSTNNYQAAVALRNQTIDLQNADLATQQGELSAQESGMQTRATVGAIRAGQGAGNLDVNFGSNKQVSESAHEVGWADQQITRSNAALTAFGYKSKAANEGDQATLYTMAGKNAVTAANYNATASILGGVSSVSSKWLSAQQSGTFGGSSPSSSNMLIYGPGN